MRRIHGECGARAYNGGLGRITQRGTGAESLARVPEVESPRAAFLALSVSFGN